ncbi:MAG: hypothetical protein ABGZ35_28265 [Planctomycetaceae bacterium]
MSVSNRLLILPLGLLITVTGCSGNRLRQIFAPDREFMALHELDRNDGERDDKNERSEQFSESLASRTDEIDDQKVERFFSISRWLNPTHSDAIPPDPFLETNHFDQSTPVDHDDPVAVVGHSNQLKNGEKEEFVVKDEPIQRPLDQETTDTNSPNHRQGLPTFADVLAEFEEADENSDDLDALAEEWLADEMEEENVSDFDVLLSGAMGDSITVREDDSDGPTLDFDVANGRSAFNDSKEPNLKLADTDESLEDFEELLENDVFASASDPFSDKQEHSPAADHVDRGAVSIDESLWESADSGVGWALSEPKNDEFNEEPVATARPGRSKKRGFGEPTKPAASGMQLRTPIPGVGLAAAAEKRARRPASSPARATEKMPFPVTAAEINSQISGDDPFLSDFETETTASTGQSVPSRTSAPGSVAPRTWLMLLGGVVIAYLLFAPERKNLRQPNNR